MRAIARWLVGSALALLASAPLMPAAAQDAAWQPVTVPAAGQRDMVSAAGRHYRIFLAVPAAAPPPAGYPVFYVLDGNAAFPVAAFLARSAAARYEITGQAAPLVVGIGYPGMADFDVPARRRDYTTGPGEPSAEAGDAGQFRAFIESELKPLIAAMHPVDRRRQALFGHSFGGLFVVQTLLERPDSFTTYIASSPSLWWQDKAVFDQLPGLLQGQLKPRVQISVGAREDDPPQGNYPPALRALIASRLMLPPARELAGRLAGAAGWADRVAYHELAGEDHGPVWLPALSRGMQFFLDQP